MDTTSYKLQSSNNDLSYTNYNKAYKLISWVWWYLRYDARN